MTMSSASMVSMASRPARAFAARAWIEAVEVVESVTEHVLASRGGELRRAIRSAARKLRANARERVWETGARSKVATRPRAFARELSALASIPSAIVGEHARFGGEPFRSSDQREGLDEKEKARARPRRRQRARSGATPRETGVSKRASSATNHAASGL
jgi:hypothetical protein